MQYKIINIKTSKSQKASMGALSVFEGTHDIPFEIKRIYYICGTKTGVKRGMHAHKTTDQMLICLQGKICINLDDGLSQYHVTLDNPSVGLFLPACYWHDMVWEDENSILLVAASDYYNEDDYIRDYSSFLDYYGKRECKHGG